MFWSGILSSSLMIRFLIGNACFVIVKISRNSFGDYVRWCWVSYSQPNLQDRVIVLKFGCFLEYLTCFNP
jgi:hypothetical protein